MCARPARILGRTVLPAFEGGGSGGPGYFGNSDGTDEIIFMGDSITNLSFQPAIHPNVSEVIASLDPGRVLTYVNEGVNGYSTVNGVLTILGQLAAHPTAKYFGLGFGRNDFVNVIYPDLTPESTKRHFQIMINACVNDGRIPIIPTIMYSYNPIHAPYQEAFNDVIAPLVAANNLPIGPDLWTYFMNHPGEYDPDMAHPNVTGRESINRLWAERLLEIFQGGP